MSSTDLAYRERIFCDKCVGYNFIVMVIETVLLATLSWVVYKYIRILETAYFITLTSWKLKIFLAREKLVNKDRILQAILIYVHKFRK